MSVIIASFVPTTANAVINIPIPNGNFENNLNDDSEEAPLVGLLGSYNREFGDGPWSASGSGFVAGIIAAPETTIGSGVATVSGLASANVIGIISNEASFYQNNIGTTFQEGYEYTLTAQIITTEDLDLTAFSNAGAGIGLLANGLATPSTGPGVTLDLNLIKLIPQIVSYICIVIQAPETPEDCHEIEGFADFAADTPTIKLLEGEINCIAGNGTLLALTDIALIQARGAAFQVSKHSFENSRLKIFRVTNKRGNVSVFSQITQFDNEDLNSYIRRDWIRSICMSGHPLDVEKTLIIRASLDHPINGGRGRLPGVFPVIMTNDAIIVSPEGPSNQLASLP